MNEQQYKKLNRRGAQLRRKLNLGIITDDELEELKQVQRDILALTHPHWHAPNPI